MKLIRVLQTKYEILVSKEMTDPCNQNMWTGIPKREVFLKLKVFFWKD